MMKRLAYGAILWFIPYVTAIPLMPLITSDNALFKTIMIVEGALVGAASASARVQRHAFVDGHQCGWSACIDALTASRAPALPR